MKKHTKRSNQRFLFNLVLSLSLTLLTIIASAREQVIQLTKSQCKVSVVAEGGDGCDKSQCNGDASCVCLSKGDHVKWKLASKTKFKINFTNGSPLKDNCGKHFKKDKLKCVVKEDVTVNSSYDYEIALENCDEATDPRIIIKGVSGV